MRVDSAKHIASEGAKANEKGITPNIGVTEAIIAGYKSDTSHILNGSQNTMDGHSWELLFDGVKPTFEEIKPYIASAIENGEISRRFVTAENGKIIYKSLNIDGVEIWVKEFVENGISRLSDAGVNNW